MSKEKELVRSNKVTAYWEGDGVAVGVFYRTHDKIATIKSDSVEVGKAGFKFPEGTDEEPVTAQQKLEAYKTFLMTNASTFGIMYDPVDRRQDEYKFPSRYDNDSFAEYSKKMTEKVISDCLDKVNSNVIVSMVKNGHVADGTVAQYGIDDNPEIEVSESYKNGGIKYGTAKYGVVFDVNGQQLADSITVEIVSGQLKKPRELEKGSITMTSLKNIFIEAGLLPKIEKPKKEDSEKTDNTEAAEDTE